MKILQVMAGANLGGAEGFYLDALSAIAETEHSQCAITRGQNAARLSAIKTLNIPIQTASFNKHLYCATHLKIKRALTDFKPDIAHHWMGRAASFAVKGAHVNIGWYGAYYHPKYYTNCDHHVAVTRDVADHIVARGIDAKCVHVLHIYSERETSIPVSRDEFNTPKDAPVLLSLARLHPVKGLDMLLRSLVEVPEAYLWLAGSGPEEDNLRAQTKELGLEARVRFLGWREDRGALLAAADICVFPSRNDSFGAVILEAWASETPLIATKAPGPKAYIQHEENGLLVEIDDMAGFSATIQRALKDKDLCKSMTENGLKAYSRDFTRDAFKRNVIQLYETVLR